MAFTMVFTNGEPRDHGAFDKYEVTDQNVTSDHGPPVLINLHHNGFGERGGM
jgi:hypothetical protein